MECLCFWWTVHSHYIYPTEGTISLTFVCVRTSYTPEAGFSKYLQHRNSHLLNGCDHLLAPVSLILVSYWNIISTVIQMQSAEGRLKAFSTCGSHLIVVVLFYGSGIFTYMRPNSKTTKERDKMISVFYTVITPMLNPIIYSLRNKDVKEAMNKVIHRMCLTK